MSLLLGILNLSLCLGQIDALLVNRQADAVEKSKGKPHDFFGKRYVTDQRAPLSRLTHFLVRNRAEDNEQDGGVVGEGKLVAGQSANTVIKRAHRDEVVEEKVD